MELSWFKKIAAKNWKANDWVEMLAQAFKLMDHPTGPYRQWTKLYYGHVSFMNKAKNIRIQIAMNMDGYFKAWASVGVGRLNGEGGGKSLEWSIKDFKRIPYDIVKAAYEIIDSPPNHGETNENQDEPDPTPDIPISTPQPSGVMV